MIRLRVTDGQDAGKQQEWSGETLRIGRAEENDFVVPDWHISSEHAVMTVGAGETILRDLNSTNGTRVLRAGVTHELAEQKHRELPLEPGDVILLGAVDSPVRIEVDLDDAEGEPQIVSLRKVVELQQVENALGEDGVLLRDLYDAQKNIGSPFELEEVLDAVAVQAFRFLPRATHVTVALRNEDDEGRGRYVPLGSRVRGGSGKEAVAISRSVFRKVVSERAAVLAADAAREVGETASIMTAKIRSTIGVPLWQGEDIIGVLQVDNRDHPAMFRDRDLDVLALLAQGASQAFSHARLYHRLRVAEERVRKENVYLKKREESRRDVLIIGDSAAMTRVLDNLRKVVNTRVTVLIEGETGTGKELIASSVHTWSERRNRLFVAQNCAALPENLLESELFGHRKGSFTGATEDKKGLFELADGGTLFLDELGEMALSLQAKLLRALQEGEIRPIGSNKTIKVDTRIVAATNRDLEREVAEGRFREDLYYRLKVFPIQIPALRERLEDIPLLAQHFLKKFNGEFGRNVEGISHDALALMKSYSWPGNVRELSNEVQRVVIHVDDGEFVEPEHLSAKLRQVENVVDRVQPTKGTLREMVDQVERWILLEALKEHNNNKSQTARTLGITREGLHKKLRSFGIA